MAQAPPSVLQLSCPLRLQGAPNLPARRGRFKSTQTRHAGAGPQGRDSRYMHSRKPHTLSGCTNDPFSRRIPARLRRIPTLPATPSFPHHKDRHAPPPPGPTRSPHLARQPARPAGKEHSTPLKKISSRPPPLGPSYIRSLLAAAVFACRCPRFQNLRIASPWPSRMQVCDVSPARSSGTRLA